jgi:carboxymethylenebutenolidase
MSRTAVDIKTRDGLCPSSVFRPEGKGPWPAVIFYMDAPAIRPALFDMGERLASHGYYVLLPDMFYRAGPYEPFDASKIKTDEDRRARFGKFRDSINAEKAMSDTAAFIAFLDGQPDVAGKRIGCTGYCMGAGFALRAAAAFPDRIAAAAGYHGGRLATDDADSPHLLAPKIEAKVFIGGAEQDAGFPPEQKDRLAAALTAAGVPNTVEIWEGARHGYTMKDLPVYNEAAAERHWRTLFALLDETLRPAAAAAAR